MYQNISYLCYFLLISSLWTTKMCSINQPVREGNYNDQIFNKLALEVDTFLNKMKALKFAIYKNLKL